MICSVCEKEKPKYRAGKQCFDCVKAWHAAHYQKPEVKLARGLQSKQWRIDNRERHRRLELKSRLKTKYNMTLEEYDLMLLNQNNTCKICKSPDPKRKGALGFFVEHNHTTLKVRGLVRHPCNLAIAYLEEDKINT